MGKKAIKAAEEKILAHYVVPNKPVESYPFIIDSKKMVKVISPGFNNALNRVLEKHPNKFVNIKHARNMDLISAKVEAAAASRATHKHSYVHVNDSDGECFISPSPLLKGSTAMHCYSNGSEIALGPNESKEAEKITKVKTTKRSIPAQSEKAKTLIEKQHAATASKNATVKESTEKAPKKSKTQKEKVMATATKKAAKKSAKKAAKKTNGEKRELKTVTGAKKDLKVSEILKLMKNGQRVYRQSSPNSDGQLIEKRLKKYANQDKVIAVVVVAKEK